MRRIMEPNPEAGSFEMISQCCTYGFILCIFTGLFSAAACLALGYFLSVLLMLLFD